MSQTTYPVSLLAKQVTRHKGLRRAMGLFSTIVLVVAFTACLLLVVWTRQLVVHTGYAIEVEHELQSALAYRNDELVSELGSLRSPGRLAPKAAEFKMSAPANEQVLRVPR
ncbi:MAG: hypothetical protein P9M14_16890 [Candidatus Alcyoniella australis]|nr:hypothetical protein [Candidatus Alcyoniella australis]